MNKKNIRFIGFLGDCDNSVAIRSILTDILKNSYVLTNDGDPDYIISSESGLFSSMKYDCVRILFATECFAPDFNVFDYAIGPNAITCLDDDGENRYYQLRQSILNGGSQKEDEGLKQFLFRILDQSPEHALRRLGAYHAKYHERCLNEYRQFHESVFYPLVSTLLK